MFLFVGRGSVHPRCEARTNGVLHPHIKAAKGQGGALAGASTARVVVSLFARGKRSCLFWEQLREASCAHLCHEDGHEAVVVRGLELESEAQSLSHKTCARRVQVTGVDHRIEINGFEALDPTRPRAYVPDAETQP